MVWKQLFLIFGVMATVMCFYEASENDVPWLIILVWGFGISHSLEINRLKSRIAEMDGRLQ